jgi:hypothetical protein
MPIVNFDQMHSAHGRSSPAWSNRREIREPPGRCPTSRQQVPKRIGLGYSRISIPGMLGGEIVDRRRSDAGSENAGDIRAGYFRESNRRRPGLREWWSAESGSWAASLPLEQIWPMGRTLAGLLVPTLAWQRSQRRTGFARRNSSRLRAPYCQVRSKLPSPILREDSIPTMLSSPSNSSIGSF